jgi:hypothetical protein
MLAQRSMFNSCGHSRCDMMGVSLILRPLHRLAAPTHPMLQNVVRLLQVGVSPDLTFSLERVGKSFILDHRNLSRSSNGAQLDYSTFFPSTQLRRVIIRQPQAHDSPPSAETYKMKVIIESSQLRSTKIELKVIKQGVGGRPAEVEAVASLLPRTSIVHFACHGTQDRSKPLDSGLKLNEVLLRISRIMKETLTIDHWFFFVLARWPWVIGTSA